MTQSAVAGSECSKRSPSTTTVRSQRLRVDYTPQEVKYLLDSVRKYGIYWTTILRHYPFNQQRMAADL